MNYTCVESGQELCFPPSLWFYSETTRTPRGVSHGRTAENRHSSAGPTDLLPCCCSADYQGCKHCVTDMSFCPLLHEFWMVLTGWAVFPTSKNTDDWVSYLWCLWRLSDPDWSSRRPGERPERSVCQCEEVGVFPWKTTAQKQPTKPTIQRWSRAGLLKSQVSQFRVCILWRTRPLWS